jgi:hypothetical protein
MEIVLNFLMKNCPKHVLNNPYFLRFLNNLRYLLLQTITFL